MSHFIFHLILHSGRTLLPTPVREKEVRTLNLNPERPNVVAKGVKRLGLCWDCSAGPGQ